MADLAYAELKSNFKFRGYLRPNWPQMFNIRVFSFKYHITIDFFFFALDWLNSPISNKLVFFCQILPLVRKMQITIDNIIFDNFYNYPRKAHKISVRLPYYTSLWHSYNSKQHTLKMECKDFLAAPGIETWNTAMERKFCPYSDKLKTKYD